MAEPAKSMRPIKLMTRAYRDRHFFVETYSCWQPPVIENARKSMRMERLGGLLLTVLVTSTALTGCHHNSRQTMTDLWTAPGRWSGRIELPTISEKSEPSVSANNAATAVAKVPAAEDVADEASGKAVVQVADSNESNQGVSANSKNDALVTLEFNDSATDLEPLTTSSPQSVFTDSSAEQLERLQAAINDDAERADTRSRIANGGHDVRLRVESMLEKSRRLFDLGQLREARHTAKIAQEIGDSARLDFSPEEERPVDLVQRIDDHIRGEETADAPPKDSTAEPVVTADKNPTGAKPPVAKEQDSSNRQRRDWSGLAVFRRERKATTAEQAVNPAGLGAAKKTPIVQLSLDGDRPATDEADGAVVQANRSVSIKQSLPQASANASASYPAESEPIETTELQTNREPTEEPPELTEDAVAMTDVAPDENGVSPAWTGDRLKPPSATDEDSPPPADFDESRPISAFREINSPPQASLQTPMVSGDERPASWGNYVAATLFSLCAVAAIFWYRRGAT